MKRRREEDEDDDNDNEEETLETNNAASSIIQPDPSQGEEGGGSAGHWDPIEDTGGGQQYSQKIKLPELRRRSGQLGQPANTKLLLGKF